MKIIAISTGTLQLEPTFLEGKPGPRRSIRIDPGHRARLGLTEPRPMWSWIVETPTERILVDAGGREPVARFPGRHMRFMTAPVRRGFAPRVFDFDGPPLLGFTASWPVTPDGSVIALPTPGHSPGHTSYLVRRAGGDVLLGGDVTYDVPALEAQRDQGFVANVERHRDSLRRVLSLVERGIAYLPSHDPSALARLNRL